MRLTSVGAVNLVNKESDTHRLDLLVTLNEFVLDIIKLLNVDNDDAQIARKCLDKGLFVLHFQEHRIVNVHVAHHSIGLITQLQAVNYDKDFVVCVLATEAQIFELLRSPAYDVGFTETSSILQ